MTSVLLLNAGAGGANGARDRVASLLPEGTQVREIAKGEDVASVAREALSAGATMIIAAGGDGTVSAVAGALIGTSATLGIVPLGTSNSIGRSLGVPADVEGACAALRDGVVRVVDTARIGDRAMILLATIGLHAETIGDADPDAKRALGKVAYVLEGVSQLLGAESFQVAIDADGWRVSGPALAVTVANCAPPETILAQGPDSVVPDDGLLDLTIVAGDSTLDALNAGLELAFSAMRGAGADAPNVGWARCRRVAIDASPAQRVLVDGEIVGTTPLVVDVVPRSLRVLVAKS